jgi:hypothetical protein
MHRSLAALATLVAAWSVATAAPPPAAPATGDISPTEWLKQQPKPVFRDGHTLPPLTRYGWVLDFDTRVELAERWGYCLDFGGYADQKTVDRALADTNDPGGMCIALAARDPKTYKLAVICSRDMPKNDEVPPETWARDAEGNLLNGQAKSMDGTTWTPGMAPVYSPAAPDSVWEEAGRLRAEPLRRIREKCPIAIVLNGGEYGLGVPGFAEKIWKLDPTIVKAKGEKSWADYASERKGRAELLIANAVRKAVPDRDLYIYYTASGGEARNRFGGWKDWGPSFEDIKAASDLASSQMYYKFYTDGWIHTASMGDGLTQSLNARGREIACGQPFSYNWLSGGWPHDKEQTNNTTVSDIGTYKGFLKCFYTSGMVGGNAGYYTYPHGGFGKKFAAQEPPFWLEQLAALAQVHAQFSHLEHYLRDGDLLPGPVRHVWSKDLPANEFPTGDKGLRVLARRLKDRPQWLIAAWAADGKDREVKVTIPELGEATVLARADGGLYEATLKDGVRSIAPAPGSESR